MSTGQPIPFIEIIDVEDSNQPRFEIHPKALTYLANLKDKYVNIINYSTNEYTLFI